MNNNTTEGSTYPRRGETHIMETSPLSLKTLEQLPGSVDVSPLRTEEEPASVSDGQPAIHELEQQSLAPPPSRPAEGFVLAAEAPPPASYPEDTQTMTQYVPPGLEGLTEWLETSDRELDSDAVEQGLIMLSHSPSALEEKILHIEEWAFQLGVRESKEMQRGTALNILG
mmetsp:Transcript_31460/g.78939  ORF Transcript_31460/g.78939 Transcript_31460/m.78939 type:complete len:170 (-) Transcript_31460:169-678(-)